MGPKPEAALTSQLAACLWIPDFALACERARKPVAVGQPAALLATFSGRLSLTSREARVLGVRRGMTVGQGIGLAPTLHVFEPDPVLYGTCFDLLVERLRRVSPVVQPSARAITEGAARIFIGMDGLEPLYGAPEHQLELIRQVSFRALPEVMAHAELRLGWAWGKFAAWVAAAAADPERPLVVREHETQAFLAGRPVAVLPAPLAVIERLERLGLATIQDVAALPESALASQFGRVGRRLWRCAAGKQLQRVRAHARDEPIAVALEFPEPVGVYDMLCRALDRLVARALASPKRQGRSIKAVYLNARLEQQGSWSTEAILKDPVASAEAIRRPLCQRLAIAPPIGAVEQFVLRFTAFGPCTAQPQLFERGESAAARSGRAENLRAVVDEVRSRNSKLYCVMELMPWSRIPERRHALIACDP